MTRAASTTLVLLSYDEREAVELLLPLVPLAAFDRVVAVDGGSTDGTLDVYRAHGIECHTQAVRGRGNAFRLAQDLVDTDRIVFFSVDGNEDPRDLPTMLRHLDEGYDMVVAGRFLLPGAASDDSDDPLRLRKLSAIAGSAFIRLVWRSGVWDSINGFRGFQVASLKRMHLDAPLHEIELQSTIRAAKLGMRTKEFPTREQTRLGGLRKRTAGTATLAWRLGRFLVRELWIGGRF